MKSTTSFLFVLAATTGSAAAVEPDVLLDRSFGQDGIALSSRPSPLARVSVRAVRSTADGSIFIGGSHNGHSAIEPYVLKLDGGGTVDPGFGTLGLFALPLDLETSPGATMGDIALLGDGRIVFAAGLLGDDVAFLTRSTSLIGVLTANGQLDTRWAGSGYREFDYGEPNAGLTLGHRGVLAVDRGDHVYLSSHSGTGSNGVARFLSDGTLDPAYGTDGIAWLPEGVALERVHLDSKQRLWGTGPAVAVGMPPRLALTRLLPSGQLDVSYGNGLVLSDVSTAPHDVVATGSLALDGEGRPLVGFAVPDPTAVRFATLDIARYTRSGGLDHSFNAMQQHGPTPGIARIAIGGSERPYTHAQPLYNGDVVVIGHADWIRTGVTLGRLRADGTTDASLPDAPDGHPPSLSLLGHGNGDMVMAAEMDAHGRLVMAGVTFDGTRSCLFVLRLIGDRLFADGQDPSDRPRRCPAP